MNGKGKLILPDETLVETTVEESTAKGYGRAINPNGDYFQGEISGNKANGKGVYVEQGVKYDGNFKDNVPHGEGTE